MDYINCTGLVHKDGNVSDNINITTGMAGRNVRFTYNSGIMAQAYALASEVFEIPKYLEMAH